MIGVGRPHTLTIIGGSSSHYDLPPLPAMDGKHVVTDREPPRRPGNRTLYDLFFGPYTKKLWGPPPSSISADWAAQRISLLDLGDVFRRLVGLGEEAPRTYIFDGWAGR